MKTSVHGNDGSKKNEGSSLFFAVAIMFALSMVVLSLQAYVGVKVNNVQKRCNAFYSLENVMVVGSQAE